VLAPDVSDVEVDGRRYRFQTQEPCGEAILEKR
jgi:hypothetical protein